MSHSAETCLGDIIWDSLAFVIHISYIQTFYIFVKKSLSVFLFSSLSCSCPSLIVQKKCDESHYYLFNAFLKFVPYLDSGNLSPSNQAYSHNMSSGALGKGRLQSKIWMNFLKNSKRPLTTAPTQPGKLCCAFFLSGNLIVFSPEIHDQIAVYNSKNLHWILLDRKWPPPLEFFQKFIQIWDWSCP